MIEILILSIMGATYLAVQLGWWVLLAVPAAFLTAAAVTRARQGS
jgi:hypothetical protein